MNKKRCDMRGCDNAAKYHYNNPHTRGRYEYCASHLGKLHPEMDVEDWVNLGYATKVYHAKTAR